jgi:hypothetical protein
VIVVTRGCPVLKGRIRRSDEQQVTETDAVELPAALQEELQESLLGDFVRADRVAEARGKLRRGESPDDDELARAIVASTVTDTTD